MRDAILDKLAEVDALLEKATCDGTAIDGSVAEELETALRTLAAAVDYYVD